MPHLSMVAVIPKQRLRTLHVRSRLHTTSICPRNRYNCSIKHASVSTSLVMTITYRLFATGASLGSLPGLFIPFSPSTPFASDLWSDASAVFPIPHRRTGLSASFRLSYTLPSPHAPASCPCKTSVTSPPLCSSLYRLHAPVLYLSSYSLPHTPS
jgi:hypothetical protein